MSGFNIVVLLLCGLIALASAKPILVTFGTNKGPITPRDGYTQPIQPRTLVPRSPAPVSEDQDDIPNPSTYRPMPPHQYRTKLYSVQPNPNLIFGTPLDQKYTPAIDKFEILRKQSRESVGVDYTGPHLFELQPYQLFEAKKLKTTLQPSVSYIKPDYYRETKDSGRVVPQIGIVYSGGVRYYVPQVLYYNSNNNNNGNDNNNQQEEQENSVYDRDDVKHVYSSKQQ